MKVAVIGRGFGVYAMKPSFEARGWQVDVIPSRDEAAVAAACAGDADLIAVLSPPFQHRDHVLRAIEAGKDVLCDKPFGINAAQARESRVFHNRFSAISVLAASLEPPPKPPPDGIALR